VWTVSNWKQYGYLTVRGSNQDLRGEVDAYLELEDQARIRWAKQMRELRNAKGPTACLAFARARKGSTDSWRSWSTGRTMGRRTSAWRWSRPWAAAN
jgi:hypothetical protein